MNGKGGIRRPAMMVLAGCFVVSAAARVLNPEGAMAFEVEKLATGEGAAPPSAAELGALLDTLRERESQLETRARELAEKERVIEAAESRIRDQLTDLEMAERRLADLVRVADEAADNDVAKLVAAYEAMGGKKAGPVFETMDDAFAAGLLTRMNDEAAANTLAAMSPDKAYAVTVYIAGQNARAPRK